MKELDPISKILDTETGMDLLKFESAEDIDQKEDFNTARKNIHDILEQSMEQLPTLMDLASQAQSDKMYQAVATMIKTLTDANVSLVKLSREGKAPKEEGRPTKQAPASVTQNNVYIGTTEDYLRELSNQRKVAQESIIDVDSVEIEDV